MVTALALLPGALYVWGFERHVGSWGIGLSDRVLRFFGASAFAHALIAPATYWLWADYVREARRPLSVWLWVAALAYVLVPFTVGSTVGRAARRGRRWAAVLRGPLAAPRAWNHFFASGPEGWIRLRLKSGTWIAGLYSTSNGHPSSYASAYPEAQDLFLMDTARVDPLSGQFVRVNGAPVRRGISLLIRWGEVELLEFGDEEGTARGQEEDD